MPLILSGTNGISSSASNWAIQPDTSGRIRMPSQIAFMISAMTGYNTDGNLRGAGNQYSFNRGGHYNSSTGRFTAPIAGTYLFICGVLVETGTGRLEGNINRNGSVVTSFNGTGTTYDGPTSIAIIDLSANDWIEIRRQSGTAHSNGGHPNTFFGGYLLG